MVSPKHNFTAEALPRHSGSILTQPIYFTNEAGQLERKDLHLGSYFDSITGTNVRIGADADDRYGFDTAAKAQIALDAHLLQTAQTRGL